MKTMGSVGLAAAAGFVALGMLEMPSAQAPSGATPEARQAQDWEWQGRIDSGDAIELKGVNGDLEARGTGGDQVRVTAVKRGRDDDPSTVRIDVVEHAGGVTICAVPPDVDGKPNECRPGDEGRLNSRDNDVSVHFTVQVPSGVRFVGTTVNGDVEARDLEADARVTTVNGDVHVSTSGLAQAKTVNGSIHASMGRGDWDGKLSFHTVNGSITVDLPADVDTEVSAATVNGSLSTDFPLTVKGRFSMKNMRGTIGDGGRELDLNTVNGSIELNDGG